MKNNNMSAVVISAHPYNKSYNAAMVDTAIKKLKEKGYKIFEINLFKDKYEPELYKSNDSKQINLVKSYKKKLKDADHIYVFYPTWWSSGPAHLEAFYEQVLTVEDFYNINEEGMIKPEQSFDQVQIFTSSFTPNIITQLVLLNANKNKNAAIWRSIGAKTVSFNNIDRVNDSAKRRAKFLVKIKKSIKDIEKKEIENA